EALATRLANNTFAQGEIKDFASPVIRLEQLTAEDCFVLLSNIRNVQAGGDATKYLIPDEGIASFLEYCYQRIGAACFQTPRDTIKSFVGLLNVLDQNPETTWQTYIESGSVAVAAEEDPLATPTPDTDDDEDDDRRQTDDLTTFKL